MSQLDQLFAEPENAKFIETHQGASGRITQAAKLLLEKDDALKALKKLLPALTEKEINVFFSYKKKDKLAAKTLVDKLRSKSAGKLKITYHGLCWHHYIINKTWKEGLNLGVSFICLW